MFKWVYGLQDGRTIYFLRLMTPAEADVANYEAEKVTSPAGTRVAWVRLSNLPVREGMEVKINFQGFETEVVGHG